MTRRKSLAAMAAALLAAALPGAVAVGGKSVDLYAAIAYSPATGQFGYAHRQHNRSGAEKLALKNCGAADAQVVCWVRDGWCALAVSKRAPRIYGSGFAARQADSVGLALQQCGKKAPDATILVSIHSEK